MIMRGRRLKYSYWNDLEKALFQRNRALNIANSNIGLDNFIKSLKYTGLEQVRTAARAIASSKREVIVEAAVANVDSQEQLIPILEAYKLKYPNAIQQLCCNELNQSSNISDDSNPEGKIINFENYSKNADTN